MGVVDDAVEDSVGDAWLADDVVPSVDRDLAGNEGGCLTVALLDDLQQVAALVDAERLERPIVEDEQPHLAEPPHQARIATVGASEGEIGEQLGDALVEDGAVVAASLVAERAGEPRLADACRAFDDEILWCGDPVAGDQPLEQRAVEAARRTIVDVLDDGALAPSGMTEPSDELPVGAFCALAIEQRRATRRDRGLQRFDCPAVR